MPDSNELGSVNLIKPDVSALAFSDTASSGDLVVASIRPLVVGEGTSPIPARVVTQTEAGDFVDLAEELPDKLELLRRMQATALAGASEAGQR